MGLLTEHLEEALLLIKDARAAGIECRLVGSLAVFFYVGERFRLRPVPAKDIDLVSVIDSRRELQTFLKKMSWILDDSLLMFAEKRETYRSGDLSETLDVYYDEIDGNHAIDVKGRLDITFPAITLTDLLLTKLQRVQMRIQDCWDTCALLELDPQGVELKYFAAVLGSDWGLYTTVMDNLEELEKVGGKTRLLQTIALSGKKSLRWRLRSLVGRRKRWWKVVSDTRVI